ncbi:MULTISPECIES: radical SAM/SPASM domain-containing protein [Paenibacillus]|jgi:uncharacterized protein|nr:MULTISPECIES: radical SAM protein [Paenibacillus]KAF6617859.1 SPASM domain-containing protein [Paenibacillus sp. EKM101P]KAF6618668.1 SPASM domain-containing protein [Paenibacillus sp. EKM102P]KAF6626846.1 SPASM domain-containing protein [Paenibacillus sp. EKM10P]KAF6646415.1 SPASM domain-containing protein [Paenibacillus sp. EKM11P]KJD38851.1 arylsulfatase [Paenibacillus polymyxa]
MKASQYNFIFNDIIENTDKTVLYNSRTGALAVLEPEYYKQFCELTNNGLAINNDTYLKNLIECGYIVEDNMNEKAYVKVNLLKNRFESSNLMLTIAPTMACNFRCVYCFEKDQYHNKTMSQETAQSIVNFVKTNASKLDTLNVTWYGGEPLIAMKQIVRISEDFLEICKENNIQYTASVITNGYLLNKEKVQTLISCGVNDIQVTVDGPKEVHDLRRPLVSGRGTFDVIMNNLKQIKGMIKIFMRINTDQDNWLNLHEIVGFLKENSLLENVIPYLGLVTPTNGKYEGTKCLTDEMYSKFNLKFMSENDIPISYIYPAPKGNYCSADKYNSFVIDPLGHLYKCWSDIGIIEQCVGNINEDTSVNWNTELLGCYLLYDPTEDEKCSDCKYLPVCLGGCPHNRMADFNICEQYRYNLQEYITECTKVLLAGQLTENKKEVSESC